MAFGLGDKKKGGEGYPIIRFEFIDLALVFRSQSPPAGYLGGIVLSTPPFLRTGILGFDAGSWVFGPLVTAIYTLCLIFCDLPV